MSTGSSYESYEKTHSDYDKTRAAVGSEQIIQALKRQRTSQFAQLRVLDAGCGTGTLLLSLKKAGFKNLTGVDASTTGLGVAAKKLGLRSTEEVKLICADIRSMPFAAASFDAIIFSFVVQHLPHKSEEDLKNETKKLFAHVSHLLAPGGQIIIVTCSKGQLSADHGCMWYYKYFPQAAAKLSDRFLNLDVLSNLLIEELGNAASAEATSRQEALEETYWTDASLDPRGPLDKSWRHGDSLFALCEAEPEVFQVNLARLKADIESGAVNEHIAAVRTRAQLIKQGVLLFAEAVKSQ